MAHDEKSLKEFNKLDETNLLAASLYASLGSKLKTRGPKFTPPKKKRKKNK
jgi:hypothetical protein